MRLPFAIGILLLLIATGSAAEDRRDFNIAPQGLPSALELLVRQAGIELLYDSEAVEGKVTEGVTGRLTVTEAMALLLRGTGLGHTFTTPTTVAIQAITPARNAADPATAHRETSVLPTLVVSATRGETLINRAPAAVSVVTARELQTRHVMTVDQALNLTPGGYFRRGKGLMDTGANISLRGFPTMRRTAILLNGIPLNDTYTGDANFSSINLDDVEQIEVVRGPFSSLYGGNAMGGVINIITKESGGTQARLKLGHGDAFTGGDAPQSVFNASFSGSVQFTDALGVRASLSRHTTDGYPTNFITRTTALPSGLTGARAITDTQGNPRFLIGHSGDNGYKDTNLALAGKYRLFATADIGVNYTHSRSRYDYIDPRSFLRDADGNEAFITSTGGASLATPTPNYLTGPGGLEQNQYIVSQSSLLGNATSKLMLGYIDQVDGWFVTPSDSATRDGGPGTGSQTTATHRILDWQIETPVGDRHTLTTGLFLRQGDARNTEHALADWRDRDSVTTLSYQARGQELARAVFAQDRYDITDRLTAYLGARYDWWETRDGLADSIGVSGYPIRYPRRSDSRFSPKAALSYQRTPETRYRLAAGRSFRAPAVFELYRTWLSPLSGTTFESNPGLDPETATSWEMGLDHRFSDDTSLATTYFSNHMQDFIYRTTASSSPPVQRFENAAKAHSRGLEISLSGRIARTNWNAGYTYTDARIDSNPLVPASEGKRIVQIPAQVATLGANWQRKRLSVGATVRYTAHRFNRDDNSDDVEGVPGAYDAYTLIDARLDYQLTERLAASLSIDNLTDEEWYDFYLAPGRSWFAQLSLEI